MALLKLKADGKQTVVVQHVQVSDGGQAVIAGQVTKRGGRDRGSRVEMKEAPHEPARNALGAPVRRQEIAGACPASAPPCAGAGGVGCMGD